MKLIEYTVQWAKGEIFEGMCIAIVGLFTLVCSFLIWKYGSTLNAKALIIPTLVLGFVFGLLGSFMMYSNNERISTYQATFDADKDAFVLSEKKRVEDFQYMYPTSLAISSVCFVITILVFAFSKSPTFHAIGIVLSALGSALIVIDYFSKERAQIYYEHIQNQLQ